MNDSDLEVLMMLAGRLERLNVDSKWARRASGTRGGIIKAIESIQNGDPPKPLVIKNLVEKSMDILSKAAKEIPDLDTWHEKDSP
jgi:hypothetical protein